MNNINKKQKKEKANIMYEEFWILYNSLPNSNFVISDNFMTKIKDKHYTIPTLSRLIIGLKWLILNYDLEIYFVSFRYVGNSVPYLNIYKFDNAKDSVYEYKIVKDDVILVNDFYNMLNK